MERIESLTVKCHDMIVGTLTLSADRKNCAFEYLLFYDIEEK